MRRGKYRHSLLRLCLIALVAIITASCGTVSQVASLARAAARYYVSLGDSLSQGVQAAPDGRSVDTPDGYPDQLFALLHRQVPDLSLIKLGCGGESTTSVIAGWRHCPYEAGTQLSAATDFLRAHRGRIALITLDLGANDPGSCFTDPVHTRVPRCAGPAASVLSGTAQTTASLAQPPAAGGGPGSAPGSGAAAAANLARILDRLRAAAGPRVPIIGMTYYAPELPEWRLGATGRAAARLSVAHTLAFDARLARVYRAHGARVADVAGAFRTTDFTDLVSVPGLGVVPRNVADVCAWSWVCAARPRGPNKHPDTAGYAVIARAFLAAYDAPHSAG